MKFSIIATSDIHGHTERFSQLAKMIQKEKPALLIDNGDFLQGSHLSYYYEQVKKETHPQITLANEIQYDVAIFGNHEFNYPLKEIANMRKACHFPWIAANIQGFAQPYFIKEVHGIRIAVIGVVTQFVPQWDEKGLTASLFFETALESAKRTVQYVRSHENVQLVILSYHGGFERDINTGHRIDLEDGENQGYEMLQQIEGIDIFITGHQHLEIATTVNGVSVVQPGANAHCFAQITVTIENGKITHNPELIYVDDSIQQQSFEQFNHWKNTWIGDSEIDLSYSDFFSPRFQSIPYTQLIHQMQLHFTDAQLSVTELPYHSTGGFFKSIYLGDVLHNLPRTNYLKVIALTGSEIRDALELCAAVFELNDANEIDFSSMIHYPKPHPYTYDCWGGLDYELTISKAVGQRVTKLYYQGREIQPDDVFEVAINSYRATGSHQFMMMQKQAIREVPTIIPKLMMRYIQEQSPLKITLTSSFQVRK
ncbi:bifunctional metallophosphatase/5'-nucleotidase [Solibacillus sp. R5-41]|uniref:bifunctional metallophosphatase/5'-nucleotidase n=1 Tax=Solibacillus sp. R5-41 TaxID=2048654 RepID=UPI000C128E84|nr:bifunctional UDP-sugar hydrolase/5'-nucleotidase [Solibacillus sp. R5-41]ATP39540.1 bifunctional metallophosphatase/5'-nucleotidase [Solibacillus sp. R5-41]